MTTRSYGRSNVAHALVGNSLYYRESEISGIQMPALSNDHRADYSNSLPSPLLGPQQPKIQESARERQDKFDIYAPPQSSDSEDKPQVTASESARPRRNRGPLEITLSPPAVVAPLAPPSKLDLNPISRLAGAASRGRAGLRSGKVARSTAQEVPADTGGPSLPPRIPTSRKSPSVVITEKSHHPAAPSEIIDDPIETDQDERLNFSQLNRNGNGVQLELAPEPHGLASLLRKRKRVGLDDSGPLEKDEIREMQDEEPLQVPKNRRKPPHRFKKSAAVQEIASDKLAKHSGQLVITEFEAPEDQDEADDNPDIDTGTKKKRVRKSRAKKSEKTAPRATEEPVVQGYNAISSHNPETAERSAVPPAEATVDHVAAGPPISKRGDLQGQKVPDSQTLDKVAAEIDARQREAEERAEREEIEIAKWQLREKDNDLKRAYEQKVAAQRIVQEMDPLITVVSGQTDGASHDAKSSLTMNGNIPQSTTTYKAEASRNTIGSVAEFSVSRSVTRKVSFRDEKPLVSDTQAQASKLDGVLPPPNPVTMEQSAIANNRGVSGAVNTPTMLSGADPQDANQNQKKNVKPAIKETPVYPPNMGPDQMLPKADSIQCAGPPKTRSSKAKTIPAKAPKNTVSQSTKKSADEGKSKTQTKLTNVRDTKGKRGARPSSQQALPPRPAPAASKSGLTDEIVISSDDDESMSSYYSSGLEDDSKAIEQPSATSQPITPTLVTKGDTLRMTEKEAQFDNQAFANIQKRSRSNKLESMGVVDESDRVVHSLTQSALRSPSRSPAQFLSHTPSVGSVVEDGGLAEWTPTESPPQDNQLRDSDGGMVQKGKAGGNGDAENEVGEARAGITSKANKKRDDESSEESSSSTTSEDDTEEGESSSSTNNERNLDEKMQRQAQRSSDRIALPAERPATINATTTPKKKDENKKAVHSSSDDNDDDDPTKPPPSAQRQRKGPPARVSRRTKGMESPEEDDPSVLASVQLYPQLNQPRLDQLSSTRRSSSPTTPRPAGDIPKQAPRGAGSRREDSGERKGSSRTEEGKKKKKFKSQLSSQLEETLRQHQYQQEQLMSSTTTGGSNINSLSHRGRLGRNKPEELSTSSSLSSSSSSSFSSSSASSSSEEDDATDSNLKNDGIGANGRNGGANGRKPRDKTKAATTTTNNSNNNNKSNGGTNSNKVASRMSSLFNATKVWSSSFGGGGGGGGSSQPHPPSTSFYSR